MSTNRPHPDAPAGGEDMAQAKSRSDAFGSGRDAGRAALQRGCVAGLKAERDALVAEVERLKRDSLNGQMDYITLRGKLDEAESRALAAEGDAGRYRWLRDRVAARTGFTLTVARATAYSLDPWSGDDLDTAIDTARATQADRSET